MESYINKTRNELIVICKDKKIKNYSNKKKNEIIQLLLETNTITSNTETSQVIIRYMCFGL